MNANGPRLSATYIGIIIMIKSKRELAFKNIVRGRTKYRRSRHKISASLLSSEELIVDSLSPFLKNDLFKIKETDWLLLNFDQHDWRTLDEIRRRKSATLDKHFLSLLTAYVVTNSERIVSLYDHEMSISSEVMNGSGENIAKIVELFDDVDKQSLFTFRVICGLHASSSEDLKSYFTNNFKTNWLRKRFLYPLIYNTISCPSDSYLDTFLSYVTTGEENDAERATIRFLLRDDLCTAERCLSRCPRLHHT